MTIPDELKDVIVSDLHTLGGTPRFKGTRIPLETFLDHIEYGYSLDYFLRGYSGVSRQQAMAVLEWQSRESRKAIGLELAS